MLRSIQYMGIQGQIAEELSKHGMPTVLVTASPEDLDLYRRMGQDPKVFAGTVCFSATEMSALDEPLPPEAELQADVARIEKAHGISLADAIRCDRQYGAGFVTGAKMIRTPFMRNASYSRLLLIALRVAEFFVAAVERYKPRLVIGYSGAISNDLLIQLAEARNIPIRMLAAPRRKNFFYWSGDRYGVPAAFDQTFERAWQTADATPPRHIEAAELQQPKQMAQVFATRNSKARLPALIRGIVSHSIASFSFYWFKHPRRRMIYMYSDKVIAFFHSWLDLRADIRGRPVLPTLDPAVPFIFFPMHLEPEISLLVEAARSPSQLTAIEWLARAAPSGWKVVVKEHPVQMMRRPSGFWDALRRLPNVVVASKFESGEAIAGAAKVVAVINGTLGIQAALQLKPVLAFNADYIGKVFPQVSVVESLGATKVALRNIAEAESVPPETWQRANDTWDRAWKHYEFPIEEWEGYQGKASRKRLPDHEMRTAVERLIQSF